MGHADYVLVGDLGDGFTVRSAERRVPAPRGRSRSDRLAEEPLLARKEEGLTLDAGPFVAALEYASGKSATVVGKPEAAFFRLALEDMGLDPGAVAMVGTTRTDVAGAQAAGFEGYPGQNR